MKKKNLRDEVLSSLSSLTLIEHNRLSSEITTQLISSKQFANATTIGITISRFPEVATKQIIEAAWRAGKRIAIPKCNPNDRTMDFRSINTFDMLETVYMDLLEPKISETISLTKTDIDIQIVPGVVFNDEGYRIGFGGGYYDRYLEQYNGSVVSLAFEQQIRNTFAIENHDIPVQTIYTPTQIIHYKKG